MIHKILNGVVPYKPVRFLQPPQETYAVYFDDIDYYGADEYIALERHAVRIELYSETIDTAVEQQIIDKLINLHLEFNIQERTWLDTEQLYMAVFYFEYIGKKEEV